MRSFVNTGLPFVGVGISNMMLNNLQRKVNRTLKPNAHIVSSGKFGFTNPSPIMAPFYMNRRTKRF